MAKQVVSNKAAITVSNESVDLASPKSLVDFAMTLKQFIVEQKLYVRIQNKNYVEVEGWQFAGAATGIMPVVKSVERIDTKDLTEIKYRAEVRLKRLVDGSTVGYGVALCSNKERNKTTFEEYAVASMAQTRAVSKALRNNFAWLMKMAGYEATPAEEMDSRGSVSATAGNTTIDYEQLNAQVKKAKTSDELAKIQDSLPPEVKLDTVDMFVTRLGEIQENGAT
jgi:hypothetical protein